MQEQIQTDKKTPATSHPSHRKGFGCLMMGVGLLVLAIAGGFYVYRQNEKADTAKAAQGRTVRPVLVTTSITKREDFDVYLRGLGTVTALNTVTVRSRVDGQLIKVGYKEGDVVQEGSVIAEIDPLPYIVQKEQAEGQKARDQASLENARRDMDRYIQAGPDAISQQQIDTARSQVANYEGALKVDEAAIHAAQVQIDYCHIAAPITGRVGLRLVDKGNMVHASDTNGLVVITQIQPIAVTFTIPEDSLSQVVDALQNNPALPLDLYGRDNKNKLGTGKLLAMDNQIDATTGTMKMKAEFSNEEKKLFPNQFVNVRLLVKTLKNVVIVDSAAIQHGPNGSYVYVVKKSAGPVAITASAQPAAQSVNHPDVFTAEMRGITTVSENGMRAVVNNGLEPGETVVMSGVDKLVDGSLVMIRQTDNSNGKSTTASVSAPSAGATR